MPGKSSRMRKRPEISPNKDNMIIGVPKEIKNNEYRVSLLPVGVEALTQKGHQVLIEKDAGLGSGISNEAFAAAGAKVVAVAKEI